MARCKFCDDAEEIVVTRLGINPFSGVPVHDPQNDDVVRCPYCSHLPAAESDSNLEERRAA